MSFTRLSILSLLALQPARAASLPGDPGSTGTHPPVRVHAGAPRVLPHHARRLAARDRSCAAGSEEEREGSEYLVAELEEDSWFNAVASRLFEIFEVFHNYRGLIFSYLKKRLDV